MTMIRYAAVLLALLSLPAAAQTGGADWQKRWADTIAKAKGQELILAIQPDAANVATIEVFKKKFPGIDVKVSQMTTTVFSPRVIAEQKAGIYAWDSFLGLTANLNTAVIPFGGFARITDYFILPDVKDPKTWRAPHLRFSTPKGEYVFLYSLTNSKANYINTRSLPNVSITKPEDLLQPALKGKIAIRSPDAPNAGGIAAASLLKLKGEAFLRRVLTETNPVFMNNPRQITNAIMRGDKGVVLGGEPNTVGICRMAGGCDFVKPISLGIDTLIPRSLSVLKNAPHKEAVTVWVNWVLSKEGQETLVREWSKVDPAVAVSQRVDVAPHPMLANEMPDYTRLDKLFISINDERYVHEAMRIYNDIKTKRR